jgi:hypothetical protein
MRYETEDDENDLEDIMRVKETIDCGMDGI